MLHVVPYHTIQGHSAEYIYAAMWLWLLLFHPTRVVRLLTEAGSICGGLLWHVADLDFDPCFFSFLPLRRPTDYDMAYLVTRVLIDNGGTLKHTCCRKSEDKLRVSHPEPTRHASCSKYVRIRKECVKGAKCLLAWRLLERQ